jgi:hypothetical protein
VSIRIIDFAGDVLGTMQLPTSTWLILKQCADSVPIA